ncbi:MAG: hypothetical protein U0414_42495 [Polyangiaceae bacterium]
MTWEEYAIAGVVVVILLGGLFGFRRGSAAHSIAAQIARFPDAARPAKLCSVPVPRGAPVELTCTAQACEHSLWLHYDVEKRFGGDWTAEVIVEMTSPRAEAPARFTIGYDGEDHQSRPGLTGLLFFHDEVAVRSKENMKLANLPGLRPGERIALRVTVQGEARMRFAEAYVGVAPSAPAG